MEEPIAWTMDYVTGEWTEDRQVPQVWARVPGHSNTSHSGGDVMATRTVTADMPTLMGKYFSITLKVKRRRRVSIGLWLIRIGAWMSGVGIEVVEAP